MEFTFRCGITFPRWGGVIRTIDPGGIPPNRFYDLVNARFRGSQIVSRGGQSKHNDAGPIEGCPDGIWAPEYEPVGPFLHMRGTQAFFWREDVGAGSGAPNYTELQVAGDPQVVIPIDKGVVFGGPEGKLYAVNGASANELLDLEVLNSEYVTGVCQVGSAYFLAVTDGQAANAKIYRWDPDTFGSGNPLALDDSPNLDGPIGLFTDGTNVFAYWSKGTSNATPFAVGAVNTVRVRSALGAWSTLTFPGGITDYVTYDAESFNSKVYFAGSGNDGSGERGYLMVWDPGTPAALAVARGPLGTVDSRITRVLTFDSKLVYLWAQDLDSNVSNTGHLGDLTAAGVFTDGRKDFTAQFSAEGRPCQAFGIAAFQDSLYVMLESHDATSGFGVFLGKSPGTNTAGTWTEVEPFTAHDVGYHGAEFQHGMAFEL